jgi:ribonucleoside-diphosphate reductase alpha chain
MTQHVTKRDGRREPLDIQKIYTAVTRYTEGTSADPLKIVTATVSGLYDGVTTRELDEIAVRAAAALIGEHPVYDRIAARMLLNVVRKEVRGRFAATHQSAAEVEAACDENFTYFGLRTLYDRYLRRDPQTRKVIETPEMFFFRIATALGNPSLALRMAKFEFLPSSPTLFNAGTDYPQLSSCFLLDSPADSLEGIYKNITDVARLSKFSGGIGLAFSRVRSSGSLIRGTNGQSNGIVPWLKILDASVAAVNQCFAPETRVYVPGGTKPIAEVTENDIVLGISGTYRKVTQRLTYEQRTDDPMVAVRLKHAIESVRVTAGHPFYAIQGVPLGQSNDRTYHQLAMNSELAPKWVEAGQLAEGDFVAQVVPTEVVPVPDFAPVDARLYGIVLSDGHGSKEEWGVTGRSNDSHILFVREYLELRGIHFWTTELHGSCVQIRWATGRGPTRSADTGRIEGRGAPTMPFDLSDVYNAEGQKHISRRLSHLPPAQTWALLQGLIETDGCVSREAEVTFTNTSRPLVDGLRYQLLRMRVPTSGQYRERDTSHEGTRSDGSQVRFSGITRAWDVRIPSVKLLADLIGSRALTKQHWLDVGGCLFTRVKSVEPIESVPVVFDLIVEGDESYMTTSGLAHNGGKRKGAACVYLEPWHADIEDFLSLRDNTGDASRRTHNLNLANWVPDLFMARVEADEAWSLFDPATVPELVDLYGEAFEQRYVEAERAGLAKKTVKARDLYARMMRTLAETGQGWMTFKDKSNAACNQTARGQHVVHLSNLCTEILEVTDAQNTAVCNLASINVSKFIDDKGQIEAVQLRACVRDVVRALDGVIDQNLYNTPEAARSNLYWRPIGLGVMGLQDIFFKLCIPFDSPEARRISVELTQTIYEEAVRTSVDLAAELGHCPAFPMTRTATGWLHPDAYGVPFTSPEIDELRERMKQVGLRNSLMIAIAPTATIASIAGCYECIEPQVSNLFKRETMSGDFLQVNTYLVAVLEARGLWTQEVRDRLKTANGSVQGLTELPEDIRQVFRTAWEIPMRSLIDMAADRAPFIDQSQSLNLFVESPNVGRLSSMYFHAWKRGLKTTYYLRSRPATEISKATVAIRPAPAAVITPPRPAIDALVTTETDTEAVACSLENPEACEACQ